MEIGFNSIYYIIIALLCAMIFVGWLSAVKSEFPILMIIKRWLRFAFFTITIAVFLESFMPNRTFANLAAISALGYVLVESLLYWLQVSMLSYSQYDIFNKYRKVETAWSAQKKHIILKNEILEQGFKKSGSFKAQPLEGVEYMLTTFDSADAKTRLSIAFIPYAGISLVSASIMSESKDGQIIYSEATTAPFGLAYPPNYKPKQYPLIGNPLKLLKIHKKRIEGLELKELESDIVCALNTQLEDFQEASLKAGYVNDKSDIEDLGSLTSEGKYRIWIDTIISNYAPFLK